MKMNKPVLLGVVMVSYTFYMPCANMAQGVLRAVHAPDQGLQNAGPGRRTAQPEHLSQAEGRLLHGTQEAAAEPARVDRHRQSVLHRPVHYLERRLPQRGRAGAARWH